jgi:MarR family transcriptional regulator for hemolysin
VERGTATRADQTLAGEREVLRAPDPPGRRRAGPAGADVTAGAAAPVAGQRDGAVAGGLGPPEGGWPRLGRQLALALKGVRADLDDRLMAVDSSFPTYLVLRHVHEHPGSSQRSLAARMGIEGPTLTHHLDRLAERGLLERVRAESDRRVSSAALTPEGVAHLRLASQVVDTFDAELRSLYDDAELELLHVLLGRIDHRYGRHLP